MLCCRGRCGSWCRIVGCEPLRCPSWTAQASSPVLGLAGRVSRHLGSPRRRTAPRSIPPSPVLHLNVVAMSDGALRRPERDRSSGSLGSARSPRPWAGACASCLLGRLRSRRPRVLCQPDTVSSWARRSNGRLRCQADTVGSTKPSQAVENPRSAAAENLSAGVGEGATRLQLAVQLAAALTGTLRGVVEGAADRAKAIMRAETGSRRFRLDGEQLELRIGG